MSDDLDVSTLAKRLPDLRRRRGMSQENLAHEVGMSKQAIQDIESGKTRQPRPQTMRALAEALGTDVADLLADGDGVPDVRAELKALKRRIRQIERQLAGEEAERVLAASRETQAAQDDAREEHEQDERRRA